MLLLPAWKQCLADLNLAINLILHDVQTRWNLTYNMLVFVLEHRSAINAYMADCDNDLQKYELSEEEWALIEQLVSTLEVSDQPAVRLVICPDWY